MKQKTKTFLLFALSLVVPSLVFAGVCDDWRDTMEESSDLHVQILKNIPGQPTLEEIERIVNNSEPYRTISARVDTLGQQCKAENQERKREAQANVAQSDAAMRAAGMDPDEIDCQAEKSMGRTTSEKCAAYWARQSGGSAPSSATQPWINPDTGQPMPTANTTSSSGTKCAAEKSAWDNCQQFINNQDDTGEDDGCIASAGYECFGGKTKGRYGGDTDCSARKQTYDNCMASSGAPTAVSTSAPPMPTPTPKRRSSGSSCPGGTTFCGPGIVSGADMVSGSLDSGISKDKDLRSKIIDWTTYLYPIAAILAVVALVYAGFLYITAFGDEGKVESAKKILMWVVIGIIMILGAFAIVNSLIQGVFA